MKPAVDRKLVLRARLNGCLELEALAHEAGLHPELVRRLVALGLFDRNGRLFPRDAASRLARAVRLRRDLGLNYSGALLVSDLLDRIALLEQQVQRRTGPDRLRR
jgi:hypothetical protein